MSLMLAGCGSDDNLAGDPTQPETPDAESDAAVTVSVGVGSMDTRAGHSSSNLPDKFILNFQAEGGNTYTDVTMTRDEGTNRYQPSGTMIWGTDSRTAFVRAWTEPVDITDEGYTMTGDMQTVSVAADQTSEESICNSDFIYATINPEWNEQENSISINGDALDIKFRHAFSKIDLSCHIGDEITQRYPEAKISKVEIGGVMRGGCFNFDAGTVCDINNEYLKDAGTVTAYLNEPEDGSGDAKAEAIIVPQYFEQEQRPTLTVTLVNNGVEKTMPAVTIGTGAFYGSYRYTLDVNIGKDYVEIASIAITDWDATSTSTGSTTNIALPEVTDAQAGIFIHYADGDTGNADNLKLGNGTSQTIEHIWKSNTSRPHIVIYSPYTEDATYDGAITLAQGTDYCYASINADGGQTVEELLGISGTLAVGNAYRHIMGKLTLKFKGNDGNEITPSSVTLNNLYGEGTLNVKDGHVSTTGNRVKECTVTEWDGIMVIPQTVPQYGDMVTIVYDGKKYIYNPLEGDFTISGGEHITLTLTLPASTTRANGGAPRRMDGTTNIENLNK